MPAAPPLNPNTPSFKGYGRPNYTAIPDLFLDFQVQDLSEAEIKVMLYIFRRTYGWKKEQDAISYSQFLHGITTRDGRQLDRGAGVSRSSLWRALKSVASRGYIFVHNQTAGRPGEPQLTTVYELNIDGFPHWSPASPGPHKEFQIETPGGSNLKQPGGSNPKPTIDTLIQQTAIQHTSPVCPDPLNTPTSLTAALLDAGLSHPTASRLAALALKNNRDLAYIEAWKAYLQKHPSLTNPPGFLNQVISENAAPPASAPPRLTFQLPKSKPIEITPEEDEEFNRWAGEIALKYGHDPRNVKEKGA